MKVPAVDSLASDMVRLRSAADTARGVSEHAQRPQVSLTDVACFDLHGNGEIDPRSAFDGGDATLLLPSHAIDLPTWPHSVPLREGALDNTSQTRTPASGTVTTPDVAIRRALGLPPLWIAGNCRRCNRRVTDEMNAAVRVRRLPRSRDRDSEEVSRRAMSDLLRCPARGVV